MLLVATELILTLNLLEHCIFVRIKNFWLPAGGITALLLPSTEVGQLQLLQQTIGKQSND
jgi:hypothetical protein